MDEQVNDRTHSKNFMRQLAHSLKIATLLDAQPPQSRDDLADYCAAVRLSILETSPGATPNPMLGISVSQLFKAAVKLAPTAPLPTFPDRDQLRTQPQMLNAVNDLVAWCHEQEADDDNGSTASQQSSGESDFQTKAIAYFLTEVKKRPASEITKSEMVQRFGCAESTLSKGRAPKLHEIMQAHLSLPGTAAMHKGSKDADGNLEAIGDMDIDFDSLA